ncbi:MAG: UPF0149 family protein [Chitinophagaceae bacterium]|nr:UPF0149 family protein [Rubrivivax sp.]
MRLNGFAPRLSFEWVDGFLTALAAGPSVPAVEDWLPRMCDDAFDRAFADPADRSQALRALKSRLAVLRDQLDAQELLDGPGDLRLDPLMAEWTDEERARLVADEGLNPEQAAELQTGWVWAEGFVGATTVFEAVWPPPDVVQAGQDDRVDDKSAAVYSSLWRQIDALMLPPDSPPMAAHLAEFYADRPAPSRDDLVVEACFAVQELRLWWLDHAAVPETRRVEKTPGRNDPCPCGSGKKFKKCHGAVAA